VVGNLEVGGRRLEVRAKSCCRVVPRSGGGMDRRRKGSVRGEDARRGAGRTEGDRRMAGVAVARRGAGRGEAGRRVVVVAVARREDGRRWVEAARRSRYPFLRSRTWSLAIW
jgi:hypothetical protein